MYEVLNRQHMTDLRSLSMKLWFSLSICCKLVEDDWVFPMVYGPNLGGSRYFLCELDDVKVR